jgi:selenide,water dikinase
MQVLHRLPKFNDPKILVGGEAMDDAGVYEIDKNIAIVQSVDILTPIADDPYIFGQIVAANSLSDIYAMGAKPLTALAIINYPPDKIDTGTIARILTGIADKVKEAGACIIGGHTIKDSEIKCGVSVTGIVKPDSIITNAKAKPGDTLILTKPLGTGIISTALKMGKASADAIKKINHHMSQLNKNACEAMIEIGISSATDITGFGLLGHALEMAEASRVSMVIDAYRVPVIKEAFTLAKQKLFPGGSVKNFEFVKPKVKYAEGIDSEMQLLLCDAQTSGGLLLAVPDEKSEQLLNLLHERGVMQAEIIGAVCDEQYKKIIIEKSN